MAFFSCEEGLAFFFLTSHTGALNLAVVLGVRLDLSCILKRNGIHHSQGIRHLTRYHIALIVKCLGSGLNAKNKRLRAEMLENGVTLAVRRLFLSNLQGTNAWGPDVSQELALVESFYNHNDFVATNLAAAHAWLRDHASVRYLENTGKDCSIGSQHHASH